jgi:hypothetical protein
MTKSKINNQSNSISNKLNIVGVIIVGIVAGTLLLTTPNKPTEADPRTKQLCREYADRDHEKELAPERWVWLTEQYGGSPNEKFDWYQSCIDHNTKAVAE